MREILYRAKATDPDNPGKWIFGVPTKEVFFVVNFTIFSICKGTVGQYIGLTDKNNTEIFEGDILSGHLDDLFPEHETRLVVEWDNERAGFCGRNLGFNGYKDDFEGGFEKNFEVIGNIYDNPELVMLEVE